jgi:hypothetical protein
MNKKLVYGVGINDLSEKVYVNGSIIPLYGCWNNMLKRCYELKYRITHPTYIGCIVCDEWLVLSKFKKWFDVNYKEGLELDKDILVQGNKIYSPDTCCFVPKYLNRLLTDSGSSRGDLPIGVTALKPSIKSRRITTTYLMTCSNGYNKAITKAFKTVEEAQEWYSVTKKRIVAEQVQRALDEKAIDQRIADALLSREF